MTKSAGTALKIQTTASLQDKKNRYFAPLFLILCVVTKFQTLVSLALILNSMLEAQ
jgi:hypothetical protein